jgi:hypothetical protein
MQTGNTGSAGKGDHKPKFVLSASVGPSCPNYKLDVMIVQLLLSRYFDSLDFSSASDADYELRVDVDGLMGPKTAKAITTFQKMNSDVCPYIDGRVDKDQFTIVVLEYKYSQSFPEYYSDPSKDPECPRALADSLNNTGVGSLLGGMFAGMSSPGSS